MGRMYSEDIRRDWAKEVSLLFCRVAAYLNLPVESRASLRGAHRRVISDIIEQLMMKITESQANSIIDRLKVERAKSWQAINYELQDDAEVSYPPLLCHLQLEVLTDL